jgi:hypothetical protein
METAITIGLLVSIIAFVAVCGLMTITLVETYQRLKDLKTNHVKIYPTNTREPQTKTTLSKNIIAKRKVVRQNEDDLAKHEHDGKGWE